MDLNIKLLRSSEGSSHLIIIARGLIDAEGLKLICHHAAETIQELFNCNVLIDFENANVTLSAPDIDVVIRELGPDLRLGNVKIALVSPAEAEELGQLRVLCDSLCREDLRAAVFDNPDEATEWLVGAV